MNNETRIRITLLASLFLLAMPVTASAQTACFEAAWIEPGEVVRGLGRAAGEPDCYRLAAPGAGLLMLDVTVSAPASTEPLLTVSRGGCGFGKSLELGSLAGTPSRRLLRVGGERELLVCVGAQDPLLRLEDYRFEIAFLAFDKDEPIEVEPEGEKDEPIEVEPEGYKDEPIEVEPEGYKDEPIEVEPEGQKDEPIEVEPEGLTLELDVLAALCQEVRRDEHADVFACATPLDLGLPIAGELSNPWGDDQDVFVFRLTSPETVRLWFSSELEASVGLHDARGQRLALAGEAADGLSTLRRVKTLSPGVYFVRVQGWRGAEGAYELEVATLPRTW